MGSIGPNLNSVVPLANTFKPSFNVIVFVIACMRAASCDGALAYIFMDWRHAWHALDAGRRASGYRSRMRTV